MAPNGHGYQLDKACKHCTQTTNNSNTFHDMVVTNA